MEAPESVHSHLNELGITNPGTVYYNLSRPVLYEESLARDESHLAADGPLIVRTDPYTGRSPDDRFLVEDDETRENINWGEFNKPTDAETFDHLLDRLTAFAEGRDLFVQDVFAGQDESYRFPVRAITQKAWHSLFISNMFVEGDADELADFEPSFTILDLCEFEANPERDNTNSEAFILVSFEKNLVIIGGTHYGGEMKKSIFAVLNYVLPSHGVLPMHCSANTDEDGNTAVFFGLSGTGKTTLSADASRTLIGDDEHGWTEDGIYNFEGGCYAKMIDLDPEEEPEIYGTTERFGTILENVVVDSETREPDFTDDSITRNTRGSYPISFIPNASSSGQAGHPNYVIFLTYDAFGVLPPVSQLSPAQAMYHFLSGYTAKVAGTERGVTDPKATFSACFGEPFMVRHPSVYAELLGEKIREHDATCWLVNTGITGGPYGTGQRVPLKYTRAMINGVLSGRLDEVSTTQEPFFGLHIPDSVEEVPDRVLQPRRTWDDKAAYDEQAQKLARMFSDNFEKYENEAAPEIIEAGPQVEAKAT